MSVIYYNPPPPKPSASAGIIFYKRPPPPPAPTGPKLQISNRLSPNEFLARGDCVYSVSKRFRLCFQADGNVVLRDRDVPIWATNTFSPEAHQLSMQLDGNLVLYDVNQGVNWATDVTEGPSYLEIQDDGNAVIYVIDSPYARKAVWDTGGGVHGSWLSAVVAFAGRPFAALADVAAASLKGLADLAGQIPIIGPALHGVLLIASGPFTFTDAVIHGARIDKALVQDLRDKLTAVREIGPYAQTILSFMPGIGTGVAAAIGAGLAIAQGRPIDEAFVEGFESALPGGPAAKAAFSMTYAAATGQNLLDAAGKAGIEALGLPPEQAKLIMSGLNLVYKASQGENIPMAALEEARKHLPNDPTVRQAFDVGIAIAQGKRLQDVALQELSNLTTGQMQQLKSVGTDLIQKTPAFQAARKMVEKIPTPTRFPQVATPSSRYVGQVAQVAKTAKDGFDFGVGLMRHGGVNENNLQAIRSQLNEDEQTGFDVAVATYQAAVTSRAATDKNIPPADAGAYLISKGLDQTKAPAELVKKVHTIFTLTPQSRFAVQQAKQDAAHQVSFWRWLWSLL